MFTFLILHENIFYLDFNKLKYKLLTCIILYTVCAKKIASQPTSYVTNDICKIYERLNESKFPGSQLF